jgi:hypothetical protein
VAGAWVGGTGSLGALALGGASCGPAFSIGAGPTGDAAPPPADVVTTVDSGGGDAGALFCASQDGGHTFCEDFSDPPFPGKFKAETNNGLVSEDTTILKSPPGSALAATLSQTGSAAVATAILSHAFTLGDGVGSHFTLSDWVRFDGTSECFPTGMDGVSIAVVSFPNSPSHYTIEIVAFSTVVAIVESATPADGGAAVLTTHVVTFNALKLDEFDLWTVDIDLGAAKSATVTVNGTQGTPQTLTGAPTGLSADLVVPTLLVGASVTGGSQGCKVNVDDILFDIRSM